MQLLPQHFVCMQADIETMPLVAKLLSKVRTVTPDPELQWTLACSGMLAASSGLTVEESLPAADRHFSCQVTTYHLSISHSALMQSL